MYKIFTEATNRSFQYSQKTRKLKQTSLHECEWSMRYLLCQDVIFHRIICVNDCERQRETPNYIPQQMKQKKAMTMKRPQGRDEHVSNRQYSTLWVEVQNEDTETGQRQNFNDCKLI